MPCANAQSAFRATVLMMMAVLKIFQHGQIYLLQTYCAETHHPIMQCNILGSNAVLLDFELNLLACYKIVWTPFYPRLIQSAR